MPALVVALGLTFTRSAWVGVCRGRRRAVPAEGLPAAGASCRSSPPCFVALAPAAITDRIYSIFDLNDPTNRDRVAMLQAGARDGRATIR